MLVVGDYLVTKSLQSIEDGGGDGDDMKEGLVQEVLYVDDYCIETDDGRFTVEPDGSGLSWKTFYIKQEA